MSAPYQGLGPTLAECLTAEKIALTAELAQVKEERDEARELLAGWPDARVSKAEAERDTALRHLEAVLEWSNTKRFAGRTRHENDAPSSARSFLDGLDELQTSPKTSKDLDLCDECGCIGLCDPRCSHVPVQQDEAEGCQSRSPVTGAQCNWDHPYERTLHKHRSDDGETWREPVPVQQEPGRYSDRERVADYLASAQGVEFHDLNDDAQREWLMRASDALRAVWSIGRLVDADDGYEVMCEPVAAMVEEVRAALVPVQQDEPEAWAATENFDPQPGDFLFGSDGQAYMFRKGGWHRYPERDRAATGTTEYSPTVPVQQDEPEADSEFFEKGETGEPPTEEELAFIRESAEDVYESGLPDIEPVPVQQEPELDGSKVNAAGVLDADAAQSRYAGTPTPAVPSVGQREPEAVPEWIIDNAAAKGWDLSPAVRDDDLQREIDSTRRGVKGRMWASSHAMMRSRVRSAINQMASEGVLPATRIKLEAVLAVDSPRGVRGVGLRDRLTRKLLDWHKEMGDPETTWEDCLPLADIAVELFREEGLLP